MVLPFRYFSVLAGSVFRSKSTPFETTILPQTVQISDLDLYGHVNNGRYLSLMDLGRIDYITRNGMLKLFHNKGWYPLIGAATIKYRRSLQLFQRYELHTKMIGWNENYFYFEQHFVRDEKAWATGMVRALIKERKTKRNVPMTEVFEALGINNFEKENIPERVRIWEESQSLNKVIL